jgi:hypothetical protein
MAPPSLDLDQFRERIIFEYELYSSVPRIVQILKEECSFEVSKHTIYRALKKWDIPVSRNSILRLVEPYLDKIIDMYRDGTLVHEIHAQLQRQSGQTFRIRGLYKILLDLRTYGYIVPRHVPAPRDPAFDQRLSDLYFKAQLSDDHIAAQLIKDGHTITERGVKRARIRLALLRKGHSEEVIQYQQTALFEFLSDDFENQQICKGFGRGYLNTYLRQQGFQLTRSVFPLEQKN